jgi:hypothetical protein
MNDTALPTLTDDGARKAREALARNCGTMATYLSREIQNLSGHLTVGESGAIVAAKEALKAVYRVTLFRPDISFLAESSESLEPQTQAPQDANQSL